jgi:hypothetical protein
MTLYGLLSLLNIYTLILVSLTQRVTEAALWEAARSTEDHRVKGNFLGFQKTKTQKSGTCVFLCGKGSRALSVVLCVK